MDHDQVPCPNEHSVGTSTTRLWLVTQHIAATNRSFGALQEPQAATHASLDQLRTDADFTSLPQLLRSSPTSNYYDIKCTIICEHLTYLVNLRHRDKMDVAGLVSSIITFVDFSWTIVRGTYDIHSSTTGATEENVHIGNVLEDLQAVTAKMRSDIPGQNDHEKALLELEYQCRALSGDLATILQKLTAKRRSGLQSLNIMFRSLIKEKEVREIEKRLGEYRGQMILRLNLILLYDLPQKPRIWLRLNKGKSEKSL